MSLFRLMVNVVCLQAFIGLAAALILALKHCDDWRIWVLAVCTVPMNFGAVLLILMGRIVILEDEGDA